MLQILHILCFTDVNSETETHFFLVKFLNSTSEYMNQKRQVFEFLIQGELRELISHDSLSNFAPITVEINLVKGPLKYLLMPLLGKNQLAITLHMYASIRPNLDNTHRGQKKAQFMTSSYHARCHVTRNRKMHLPEWLKLFFRIFCTITIQKPFRRNLSMRFGL